MLEGTLGAIGEGEHADVSFQHNKSNLGRLKTG